MKLAKLNSEPEIFHTIQGEGRSMGKPSIFVRTSLCNLHCIWCDTDYTWNWEGTPFETTTNRKFIKEDYIINLTPVEVAQAVLKYPCKHVVLTGGEPLMQQNEFVDTAKILKEKEDDFSFEVETNGTLIPTEALDTYVDQYNVSPKLENSNNAKRIREKPKVLDYFVKNPKAFFKFVVSKKHDLKEVQVLIKKYKIPHGRVYLMPEGTTPEDLNDKQLWLIEVCKTYGFNYTDRLHIHVYGSKRGV